MFSHRLLAAFTHRRLTRSHVANGGSVLKRQSPPPKKTGSARTESLAEKWQVKSEAASPQPHAGRATLLQSRVQTGAPTFVTA
jgi:hypothetical protein